MDRQLNWTKLLNLKKSKIRLNNGEAEHPMSFILGQTNCKHVT